MAIYTRKGDKGRTTIKSRVYKKNRALIKAIGQVDELNSFIGLAYSHVVNIKIKKELVWVMQKLAKLNVELVDIAAKPKSESKIRISLSDVKKLESIIDYYEKRAPKITNFLVYTGTKQANFINVVRAVSRRTERYLVDIGLSFETFAFVNRLSDYFFVVWRFLNRKARFKEVKVDYTVK